MQDLTQPSPRDRQSINPFRDDVFNPNTAIPGTPQIHQQEIDYCLAAIEKMVASATNGHGNSRGRLISISSPLAGYGKSHLICRISRSMLTSVTTLELRFRPTLSWNQLLSESLQHHDSNHTPGAINFSLLDEAASFFLSFLMRAAVLQGLVEERECPVAQVTLIDTPASTFSIGNRSRLLNWLKKKGPMIRDSVMLPAELFSCFSRDDIAFWTDYFLCHLKQDGGCFNSLNAIDEYEAKNRLIQFLRISSNCHPLLLIADHLDSCHGSQTAGMEIATAVTSIVEMVPNSVLIMSMNQDLWDSVFADRLPSALLDRMNGETLELAALDKDHARALISSRLVDSGIPPEKAEEFAADVSRENQWENEAQLFPRAILRQARQLWAEVSDRYQPEEKPDHPVDLPQSDSLTPPEPVFEGHSMTYPDRNPPLDMTLVPDSPRISLTDPNPEANEAPRDGWTDATPAVDGATPQHPASQHKDEPSVPPPAGASEAGEINGSKTNGVKKPQQKSISDHPLDNYFDRMVDYYAYNAGSLQLDFSTVEKFITTVGEDHPPLFQDELNVNGGQNTTLRWDLASYFVYIGFEPASNYFYYVNLLQRLLSDPEGKSGKIICFTHSSQPFDRDVLEPHGITQDVMRKHFDFIELSNSELAMVYGAAHFLRESYDKGAGEDGLKLVLKKLMPLWQRISQPISVTT